MWLICLIISAFCLFCAVLIAVLPLRVRRRLFWGLDSSKILFAGVVLATVSLFIPIYRNLLENSGVFETVLVSVHNMIRLFVIDADFEFIADNLGNVSATVGRLYISMFAVVYVTAPFLTFNFILSFMKNAKAYRRYFTCYKKDAYVFSSLNEKSLALAESLFDKRRLIVFADVNSELAESDLYKRAEEIDAVCFTKDILSVNLSLHSKKSQITYFALGEDESENVETALGIIKKTKDRANTDLYVFATRSESEIILSDISTKIKVRRVNTLRSLVNNTLYESGYEKIFCSAVLKDGVKHINACVIGMKNGGTEMVRALPWFCQMDGYYADIKLFDADIYAQDKFTAICPELLSFSSSNIDGEAQYSLSVYSGVNFDTRTFEKSVEKCEPTYIFICAGNDDENINLAIRLRTLLAKNGSYPVIQAVVSSSHKKDALRRVTDFKGESYSIDFIGDLNSVYSKEAVLCSSLEAEALERHLKWGTEEKFWQYSYNYNSSVASAIHRKMKMLCGIDGTLKDKSERTEQELWNIRKLEHKRWNAYMRSEGYTYGERNDLAKTHNLLIPFDELSIEEQKKDDD